MKHLEITTLNLLGYSWGNDQPGEVGEMLQVNFVLIFKTWTLSKCNIYYTILQRPISRGCRYTTESATPQPAHQWTP